MYSATANTLNIPAPRLDRMEVIRLAGYTEDEKVNIAMRYLVPKQRKNNGLQESEVTLGEAVVRDIVRFYTREAGVRSLEREISKVFRKVAKVLLLDKKLKPVEVTTENLGKYLGIQRLRSGGGRERRKSG